MPASPLPRRLPKNVSPLAITALGLLILYVVLQPWLNRRFGWKLPSLTANPAAEAPVDQGPKDSPSAPPAKENSPNPDRSNPRRSSAQEGPAATDQQAPSNQSGDLRFGLLRSMGNEVFVSPAGLRYTRGSEEGHRLKHLQRHTADQPNRPGKHGVFDGGMEGAIKAIDDAYAKAQAGGRDVQTEEDQENGRTIYTVNLGRRVGFIGGREGNDRNRPAARRVRIVLDGDRVITAYPL
jgi:hypothetical protein